MEYSTSRPKLANYVIIIASTVSIAKLNTITAILLIKMEKKYFYNESLKFEFISFSKKTVFETKLFGILSADIMYKHASFKSFVDSYNSIYI